jgi:hypothetical protein
MMTFNNYVIYASFLRSNWYNQLVRITNLFSSVACVLYAVVWMYGNIVQTFYLPNFEMILFNI